MNCPDTLNSLPDRTSVRKFARCLQETYHLTLVYLGEVESTILSGLKFSLEQKLEAADYVTLFQSELTLEGAIHMDLAEIPLSTLPE